MAGPNDAPEQQTGKESNQESNQAKMEQFAQQAATEILEQIRQIEVSGGSSAEIEQQLRTLAAEKINELKQSHETVVTIEQQEKKGQLTNEQKNDLKEAKSNLHQALIQVFTLADNDIPVVENRKAQKILKELAKKHISESQAVVIQETIGDWILGEKEIVFGKPGGEKSDFDKALDQIKSRDEEAYRKMGDSMIDVAESLGMEKDKMRERFEEPKEMTPEEYYRKRRENPEEAQFDEDCQQYYQRFTKVEKEFLHIFYTPERFRDYVKDSINTYSTNDELKKETKKKLLESFKDIHKEPPGEEALNELINQRVKINVSNEINYKLSDLINQLYRQLQMDRPQKFFEEVEREDFLHGIEPIRNKISILVQTLQTNLETLEKAKDPSYNIKLVNQQEEGYVIDERGDKNGKMQPYPRVRPLPYYADVNLSKYVQSLSLNFNHWRHRGEYLHNARAIFSQPAGKEGFYENLGNYAEKLSSTDLDEIMMLPDGNIVYQAFILYDKFLDEEFASQDWKHRTNQFTNQLERVNTKLEDQIITHLMELYPEAPEVRIRNAVNVAVGMSRGVFLNEPEKSAYADPTTVDGKGHPASYSTNDAASLDVFNPLHTIMRWGGEQHWNMLYFMPMEGHKGAWNHKDMWKNMDLYYKSFLEGRKELGDVGGKKNLLVDELIDFSNVGGPSKRRGWRMLQSLEGHFIYDKDSSLNYPKTYRAMDMIGYEAIADFLNYRVLNDEKGEKFLSMTAKRKRSEFKNKDAWNKYMGEVNEKNEWFEEMYKRYFQPLGEKTDFNQYMSDLRELGENKALKEFKGSTANIGNWEEFVELTTSKLFIERALIREVALRFPTKFLRLDRDRFHDDGVGNWRRVFDIVKRETGGETGWDRDHFNDVMKDIITGEMLLRNNISDKIKKGLSLDRKLGLGDFSHLSYQLDENTLKELLSEKKIPEKRINEAIYVYNKIKDIFLKNSYLDDKGIKQRKEYTFTFGLEDTDFTLMAFRGGGPRIVPRAIKDVGIMEKEVMPWIDKMPWLFSDMAVNGKHDFTPVIEYIKAAKNAYNGVHGIQGSPEGVYGFTYKIATAVINYFKKDTKAKAWFGLSGVGKLNSMAAEYAGRGTAVWEWDSRDIDRFCVALESYHLIPKNYWDLSLPPTPESFHNIFIKLPFFKHPIKTPFKKRNVDFEYNAAKLRKEQGGDVKAKAFDIVNQFLPLAIAYLLWKYIKDAMDEVSGKKKQ